jgi:hypothetical protein
MPESQELNPGINRVTAVVTAQALEHNLACFWAKVCTISYHRGTYVN